MKLNIILASIAVMVLLFFTSAILTKDVAIAFALIIAIAFIIDSWQVVPEQYKDPLNRLVTRFRGIVEGLVEKTKTPLDNIAWSIFKRYQK